MIDIHKGKIVETWNESRAFTYFLCDDEKSPTSFSIQWMTQKRFHHQKTITTREIFAETCLMRTGEFLLLNERNG